MRKHFVRLVGGPEKEFRIAADTLIHLLETIRVGAQRALRLHVEGESVRKGPRPRWVDSASRLEVTGLGGGSTLLDIEAPTLAEVAPELFEASGQQRLFDDSGGKLDREETAVGLFADALATTLAEDRDAALADKPLLETCLAFARITAEGYGAIEIGGLLHRQRPVVVKAAEVQAIEKLYSDTPEPQAVRLVGVLDTISATKPGVVLILEDGQRVRAVLEAHEPDALKRLFGSKILVSGMAHYRPSGKLWRVSVELMKKAEAQDEVWSKPPRPRAAAAPFEPAPQDAVSGVSAFFGTWPGDESDEQLLKALGDIE